MASFNRVILMGNVTRDLQLRHTQGGAAFCEVGLAVNRQWYDKATNQKKEEVTFVGVTCWGRQAEIAGQYLRKGSPVHIEGRLAQESWDDKETGKKQTKTKVVCESLQLLGKGEGKPKEPEPQSQGTSDEYTEHKFYGDDDVPF